MSEPMPAVTCPLCSGNSQFAHTPRKDRRRYECDSCINPFLIGRKADNVLRSDFAASSREAFAIQVKSTPDGFIADIYCPEIGPDDPAANKVNLNFIPADQE